MQNLLIYHSWFPKVPLLWHTLDLVILARVNLLANNTVTPRTMYQIIINSRKRVARPLSSLTITNSVKKYTKLSMMEKLKKVSRKPSVLNIGQHK